MKRLAYWCLLIALPLGHAEAVLDGGVYNTAAPTSTDIASWNTGWNANGITGWDYVGLVNGASGVYLGNGWVLTAGHVGPGTFTLQGTAYQAVNGSALGITDANGTADLTLFQIASMPDLPLLTIATTAPVAFGRHTAGDSVAMIGFGGGQGETWGVNTVTSTNLTLQLTGYIFQSTDFETAYGTTTRSPSSVTNTTQLVEGDSGGADFIYNSSLGLWTLAGINEAIDGNQNSYMVQISQYSSQIKSTVGAAVPEPGTWALLGIGLLLLARRSSRRI